MSRYSSKKIKSKILNEYYNNYYHDAFFGMGVQGKGIAYFQKQVEKFWLNQIPKNVLEVGGGRGEHLVFLSYIPVNGYYSLDLRPVRTPRYSDQIPVELQKKVNFIEGNAESIPFENATFDRVFTTCLLHHVDDILSVLLEVRRVTTNGGEIAFMFPTDPGLLNQFVKRIFTYRKIRKLSNTRPQFLYSLEHKNHVNAIMEQIKFVFESDELKFHFRPIRFLHSWNLNLCIVAKIIKNQPLQKQ